VLSARLECYGCPLCGGRGCWRVHCTDWRYPELSNGERIEIFVVRILCLLRREDRRCGGDALQYTIRVAPDFLGPYTRRPISRIVGAISRFLKGIYPNAIEAALDMGCENPKSFSKYLVRAQQRLHRWLGETLTLLGAVGGYGEPDRTVSIRRRENLAAHQWQQWEALCQDLALVYEGLGPSRRPWAVCDRVVELVIGAHNPWQGFGPAPPKDGFRKTAHRGTIDQINPTENQKNGSTQTVPADYRPQQPNS
jgi:hypothetical protein